MSSHETTTTTTTTISSPNIQTDPNYYKRPGGIIRIVEGVLCLIGFILAAILRWSVSWLSYIQFATVTGFLQALVYFLINLFLPSIPSYKPHGTMIELVLSVVWCFFLLIAGIVGAAYAPSYYKQDLIGATAAFSFFGAIAYGIGCFFLFKDWRSQGGSLPTVTSSTTSSTTTTTVQT